MAVGKLDVTSNVVRRSALMDGWQDWLCGVARVWLREHVPKLVLSLCGGVGPFEGDCRRKNTNLKNLAVDVDYQATVRNAHTVQEEYLAATIICAIL